MQNRFSESTCSNYVSFGCKKAYYHHGKLQFVLYLIPEAPRHIKLLHEMYIYIHLINMLLIDNIFAGGYRIVYSSFGGDESNASAALY